MGAARRRNPGARREILDERPPTRHPLGASGGGTPPGVRSPDRGPMTVRTDEGNQRRGRTPRHARAQPPGCSRRRLDFRAALASIRTLRWLLFALPSVLWRLDPVVTGSPRALTSPGPG